MHQDRVGPNLSTKRNLKKTITMYENWHISASMAPRYLKIGREWAYTIIYHKMDLFLSRAITLSMIWLGIVKERYNELCDKIIEAHCNTKRILWILYSNTCWGLVPFNFLIKILEFWYFIMIFVQRVQLFMFMAYNLGTNIMQQKPNIRLCT